ncbi:MAG: hypothetical protein PVG39_11770 [Desulfobacteraceae bacterium]|jgi:hypothetical protein
MRQNTSIKNVWQRNYYEHVIRNEDELNLVREYIVNNPKRWEIDRENPNSVKSDNMKMDDFERLGVY